MNSLSDFKAKSYLTLAEIREARALMQHLREQRPKQPRKRQIVKYDGFHQSWRNMLYRCNDPRCTDYKYYGWRGIKVCQEWHDFSSFRNDMRSTWQQGLTLDRIDNDKGYYKENCQWLPNGINAAKRRKWGTAL